MQCRYNACAITMFTNIDTEEVLEALLVSYETSLVKCSKSLPTKQIMRSQRLLMKCSMLIFGNTCYIQADGTAIGALPAVDRTTQILDFYEMAILIGLFGSQLR